MAEVFRADAGEKSVLITGASGFLGKYAVGEFAAHGYDVTATGRRTDALDKLDYPGVLTVPASLEEISKADMPVDAVVHIAALSSPWGRWADFKSSNVDGTRQMVDFAQRNGVRRFVFVSSPSIYAANRDRLGIPEDAVDPNNTMNFYIKSKIMAEKLLHEAEKIGHIGELVIIRPRGLIGIGDPSLVPRLLKANKMTGIPLFRNGENVVDMTCVESVARALRLATESPAAPGNTYNITNGEPRQFKQIIDEFFGYLGESPHYKNLDFKATYAAAVALEKLYSLLPSYPEPPITRYTVSTLAHAQTLDISRAKADLGYTPAIPLSKGLEKYAQHYMTTHA